MGRYLVALLRGVSFKGIGPVYAKNIVFHFKEDVFDIIENDPERLIEVDGIGSKRLEKIINGWKDQKAIRQIMVFLYQYGVSTSRAVRIYKTYGDEAIKLIRENPYRLAKDIRGIGFLSDDKIAQNMGIEKESLLRVRAGLQYVLLEAMGEGHCGIPNKSLISSSMKLLEVGEDLVKEAIQCELQAGEIVSDTIRNEECIFLGTLYHIEKAISAKLKVLMNFSLPWSEVNPDKAFPWLLEKTSIRLAESQQQALSNILSSKVSILTGGPGVGKTTLVNSVIQILKAKKVDIALCGFVRQGLPLPDILVLLRFPMGHIRSS